MRLVYLRCLLVSALFVCFAGFFGLRVSAVTDLETLYPGGEFMSVQDTISLFGQTIPFTYNTANGPASGVFTVEQYNGETVGSSISSFAGAPYIWYQASVPGWTGGNGTTVQVELHPQYSIIDSDWLYTAIGLSSCPGMGVSTVVYNPPSWDFLAGSSHTSVQFLGNDIANPGDFVNSGWFQVGGIQLSSFTVVPVVFAPYATHSESSPYESVVCKFYGNQLQYYSWQNNEYCALCLVCPFVQTGASASSGTTATSGSDAGSVTSSTASGDINVNVNVDMSQTNGLLQTLITGVSNIGSSIWSGVTGVFVPSDNAVEAFQASITQSLRETFAPMYAAEGYIDDAFELFITGEAVGTLHLPQVRYTDGDNIYTLWNTRAVPLRPLEFDTVAGLDQQSYVGDIFDLFKTIIDIVCTISVLNMLRNKFEAAMTGEVHVCAD